MTGRALAFVAASLCVAAGVVPAAAAGAGQPPRVALSGFGCQTASNPLNRAIEITATMRPLPGTQQMALKFVLLERQPGHVFRQVRGGDLGHWRHPNPPTFGQNPGDTWVVTKQVVNLAPAVYRLRVTFRWFGRGAVIGRTTRLSPACHQTP